MHDVPHLPPLLAGSEAEGEEVRIATLPFKLLDTDPEYGSATILRAETLWDHLRVRLGRYRRCGGPMFYTLSPWLWEYWYDPASVRGPSSTGGRGR